MAKKPQSQEDAFEIIELAINDLTVLTRAFDLISEVCGSAPQAVDCLDTEPLLQ